MNKKNIVERNNPIIKEIDYHSPLSVGNGTICYTADVTGMQTLNKEYEENNFPLCTMSEWGWHKKNATKNKIAYSREDLALTAFPSSKRGNEYYAFEKKKGNEGVYEWFRKNPHRFNLAQIGLLADGEKIVQKKISAVEQKLDLYKGVLFSGFELKKQKCKVKTFCSPAEDTIIWELDSRLLSSSELTVFIHFPYGSASISGSDWTNTSLHQTQIIEKKDRFIKIKRVMDNVSYFVSIESTDKMRIALTDKHLLQIFFSEDKVQFSINFSLQKIQEREEFCYEKIKKMTGNYWADFWQKGGLADFSKSKAVQAAELERRMVLSKYVTAIQSNGNLPPQEAGLTCNTWYGKFHLEMHLWHSAYFPLWHHEEMLGKSVSWYHKILKKAQKNASKNGFKGARWPKMVGPEGEDSPSKIGTLLIWQQPHIIYLLEMIYCQKQTKVFLEEQWILVKETANFMCDFFEFKYSDRKYHLTAPIIPAQEEFDPLTVEDPTFELEYWRFAIGLAIKWAQRLQKDDSFWLAIYKNIAESPIAEGKYLSHKNCQETYESYNRDHPSMLGALGLIPNDRVNKKVMLRSLEKVLKNWNYETMWGWDFAMMAMTATRLGRPDIACEILLKDTPKNRYMINGHNYQLSRNDLPVYLPGNGSLLLALSLMLAGFPGSADLPGFPKSGDWRIEFQDIEPFPY